MARPDDRHREGVGRGERPAHEEDRRRIGDLRQQAGILRIAAEENRHPLALAEAERLVGLAPYLASLTQVGGGATAYVCGNFTCDLPTSDIPTMLSRLAPRPAMERG